MSQHPPPRRPNEPTSDIYFGGSRINYFIFDCFDYFGQPLNTTRAQAHGCQMAEMVECGLGGRKRVMLQDVTNLANDSHLLCQAITPKSRPHPVKRQCLRKMMRIAVPADRLTHLHPSAVSHVLKYLSVNEGISFLLASPPLCRNQDLWRQLLERQTGYRVQGPCMNFRTILFRILNEARHTPPDWIHKHPNLRSSFFPILCNWLVELHFELFDSSQQQLGHLKMVGPRPLYAIQLAMRYLYLFMSKSPDISRSRLQLVGVSCYQVAICCLLDKFEVEKLGLDSKKFAYYTDGAYKYEEVNNMTSQILQKLGCDCKVTTCTVALRDLLRRLGPAISKHTRVFAEYCGDLCMHNVNFSTTPPSLLAAGAVIVACRQTGQRIPKSLLEDFCCSTSRLYKIVEVICELYGEAQKQETGDDFDTDILPKNSMVIKHYRDKFLESIQGSLVPRFRRPLFSRRVGPKY